MDEVAVRRNQIASFEPAPVLRSVHHFPIKHREATFLRDGSVVCLFRRVNRRFPARQRQLRASAALT